jgi:hypothetical protein
MRWPILAGLGLLASPTPALADDPLYTCAKVPADAKLTIQFTPDLTLRDLGAWLTGFTCKSVVYDTEAAARANKLALIAPAAVTPRQAAQVFIDTVQKTGLAVADRHDTYIISLDPSIQRRCPARPSTPRPPTPAGACVKAPADARLAISFKPDSTLDDLSLWLAGFTCKRVNFDPAIPTQATTVNLIVSARVTPKQASQLFVDAVESTGLVVTEKADAFDVKPGPRWSHCATAAAQPAPPASPNAAHDDLMALLDAGVRKIDDTHYEVKRAVIDKLFADPDSFLATMRIVPAMRNGRPEGFKVYAIRPLSPLARIGIANGDTIQELNGHTLDSADKALEAFTALRSARVVDISLVRRGVPMTITVTIVK